MDGRRKITEKKVKEGIAPTIKQKLYEIKVLSYCFMIVWKCHFLILFVIATFYARDVLLILGWAKKNQQQHS